MQVVAIASGLAELVLSLALGVLTAYVGFRLLAKMTHELDEINELKQNNVAAGVLFASLLLALALVVRQASYPAISALKTALFRGIGLVGALKVLGLSVAYVALALAIALGSIVVGVRVFLRLTRGIDELEEIKSNNVAVAISLGIVIVILGIFLAQGVGSLLSALIPYPAMTEIQVLGKP
jgi:uncharacterized membrane protein YjfL (UPF0719 family)